MAAKKQYTASDFITTCVNCGATGNTPEAIVHYGDCVPGDSEKWKKYYDENPDAP